MVDPETFIDPQLTVPDLIILKNLLHDIDRAQIRGPEISTSQQGERPSNPQTSVTITTDGPDGVHAGKSLSDEKCGDEETIALLQGLNDPKRESFEPTVFLFWDLRDLSPSFRHRLDPFIKWAQGVARNPLDVVMVTHLILYFTTSVPSALFLFYRFTWIHGVLHAAMQLWYFGTYTLMRHQHIHMNGILSKRFPYSLVDTIYPYITDPLMGHTWNSYYYHHVKHHHVESNGPDDLSSTIRYQRDELLHLLHYVGRFFFVIWLDLPRYFLKKGQPALAAKGAFWELSCLAMIISLARWNIKPTAFVFLLPLLVLRLGLMVGNWGQHAFVDEIEPDSDYRSSITLIDVPSNRFCFNDGYHTSHHLNPRRHWREHPLSVMKQKERYSSERALIFRNIDFLMISVRLVMKDYKHLAKCLVPIGDQIGMTLEEREEMLRTKTRRFTEEDIQRLFKSASQQKAQ